MAETEKPKETKEENKHLPILANGRGLALRSMDDMWRFACAVRDSGLVPSSFTKPEQILIAIQSGAELGMPPLRSLNSFCVIKGAARLWGDAPLALVRQSGLMEYIKEEITGEGDEMYASCESKRKDSPNSVFTTFSVEDAKQAGLWKKPGTWQQYPKRMLKYRARSFNLRDNFPDAFGGASIAEEYEGVEMPQEQTTPQVPSRDERKQAEDVKIVDTQQSIKNELDKFITALLKKIEAEYAVQFYPDQKKDREKTLEILAEYALRILHAGEPIDITKPPDYTKPENYTLEKIAFLNDSLIDGLPESVVELLPKPFETKTPEEQLTEAEATAREKLEGHKYKCECGHLFDKETKTNKAGDKYQCPKCLRLKAVKLDEVKVE